MADIPNPAIAWLPANGAWRAEPQDEPELSQTVDMLSDFANRTGGCEPVKIPGQGHGWKRTVANDA